MKPVKWCPHCQSPNGADELHCLKCNYAFRVRISVEPDEPLTTFTPRSAPIVQKRRFPWKRLALIAVSLVGLTVLCFVGGFVLYLRTPKDEGGYYPVSRSRKTPRFPDIDRRMPLEIQQSSGQPQDNDFPYQAPKGADVEISLEPSPMTNWLAIHQGQSLDDVKEYCGQPNAKAFMGNNITWIYQNADNQLEVLFENGVVIDTNLRLK